MNTVQPKRENRLILFVKFFVLPILSIVVILLIIQQFQTYTETDKIIQKTEMKTTLSAEDDNFTPRISSLSKGMDKK